MKRGFWIGVLTTSSVVVIFSFIMSTRHVKPDKDKLGHDPAEPVPWRPGAVIDLSESENFS